MAVKPSYGLTDNEIERMLRESITHAHEDDAARKLREQQVNANRLLDAVRSALDVDGALLNASERTEIENALADLQAVRGGNDVARIKRTIKKLDAATQTFAQLRMDENIRKALAGHRIEEFDVSRDKSSS